MPTPWGKVIGLGLLSSLAHRALFPSGMKATSAGNTAIIESAVGVERLGRRGGAGGGVRGHGAGEPDGRDRPQRRGDPLRQPRDARRHGDWPCHGAQPAAARDVSRHPTGVPWGARLAPGTLGPGAPRAGPVRWSGRPQRSPSAAPMLSTGTAYPLWNRSVRERGAHRGPQRPGARGRPDRRLGPPGEQPAPSSPGGALVVAGLLTWRTVRRSTQVERPPPRASKGGALGGASRLRTASLRGERGGILLARAAGAARVGLMRSCGAGPRRSGDGCPCGGGHPWACGLPCAPGRCPSRPPT